MADGSGRQRAGSRRRLARPRVPLLPMRAERVGEPKEIAEDSLLTPLPDGWRVLVVLDDRARIRSRSGIDLGPWVPQLRAALAPTARRRRSATGPTVLDAVLRWPRLVDDTWPTLASVEALTLIDVLVCDGLDLTSLSLTARLERLRALDLYAPPRIELAPAWRGSATAAWAQARHASVPPQQGILARRASAPYRPGSRSRDWLLLGAEERAERLVCGIAASGAVVLGEPAPRGIVFAGATWPDRRWRDLAARCAAGPAPFPAPPLWPSLGEIAWASPQLWVSVVPERRPGSGRGGPAWHLENVQEDLSPPELDSAQAGESPANERVDWS